MNCLDSHSKKLSWSKAVQISLASTITQLYMPRTASILLAVQAVIMQSEASCTPLANEMEFQSENLWANMILFLVIWIFLAIYFSFGLHVFLSTYLPFSTILVSGRAGIQNSLLFQKAWRNSWTILRKDIKTCPYMWQKMVCATIIMCLYAFLITYVHHPKTIKWRNKVKPMTPLGKSHISKT